MTTDEREARRLALVSRVRGLAAELRDAGFDDAGDVAEAVARIVFRRVPVRDASDYVPFEADDVTARAAVSFVFTDGVYRFRVTPETEELLRVSGAELNDERWSYSPTFVEVHADLFDAFSRNLGVRGACVQETRLHTAYMPTGSAVLDQYWGRRAEAKEGGDAEVPDGLTEPNE